MAHSKEIIQSLQTLANQFVLTDVQTAAMPGGTYVYDVLMTTDLGVKTRLLSGNAFIIQGVTP